MVYVPTIITDTAVEDKLFQNIFSLVTEYKLSNTSINIQDNHTGKDLPAYVLYLPEITANHRDMRSNNQRRTAVINIEYVCSPRQGYRQLSLMSDAFEAGLNTENNNLRLARLRLTGKSTVSVGPLDVSGQQVFTKVISYSFEVLL